MEVEINDCEKFSRNLPERKSFRAQQKKEIDEFNAQINAIEDENLKLVQQVDLADIEWNNLQKGCEELEGKITRKSEELRALNHSGKTLKPHHFLA